MMPAWTIRDLERRRRERQDHERPQLGIEDHAPVERAPAAPPTPREPIVIEVWS